MAKDTGEILQAYENGKDGNIVLRRIFPAAFTMMCVLLFVLPAYLCVYAERHPVVKYFHGEWYYILLAIPILILFVHFYHVRNGPDRHLTNLALIIPSVLLLIYGANLLTSATSKADRLFSTDCTTMLEKSHLQREWEAAHLLYRSCLKDTAKSRNLTASYLAQNFRIQDCTEYPASLKDHHDWSYLRGLEENSACTGFCKPGEQLWSKGAHKDSCSIAVASVFRYIVRGNAMQVVAMSLITLTLDMVAITFLGSSMRSRA